MAGDMGYRESNTVLKKPKGSQKKKDNTDDCAQLDSKGMSVGLKN